MSDAYRRGFTLVEVLVSMVLLTVGIGAVFGAFGEMAKSRGRGLETERMQRLAFDKYDELVGTGDYATAGINGDFKDRSEDRYVWRGETTQTSVTDLEAFTVIVEKASGDANKTVSVTGLVFIPPLTGTGASASSATGATGRAANSRGGSR